MSAKSRNAKHWCFTWNNPTLSEDEFRSAIAEDWPAGTYVVFRHETAPDTRTPHFQCYAEFGKKMRLTALKKLLPTAHWEDRKGSREQARDYCLDRAKPSATPGHNPVEVGVWEESAQGKRTDLQAAIEMMKEVGIKKMAEEMPEQFVKYGRGLRELDLVLNSNEERDPPEVTINYGPTGCGKSYTARNHFKSLEGGFWVDDADGSTWFDSYMGEAGALFDDFDGARSHMTLKCFLRLTDRYLVRVKVKGSFVNWRPQEICVTTNFHPSEWWDFSGRAAQFKALQRRVSLIRHWNGDGEGNSIPGEPPIIISRDGSPDLWAEWWAKRGVSSDAAVLGPLDNFVVQKENGLVFLQNN